MANKDNRHIIHKHTKKGFNRVDEIEGILRGKLEPGEIALNIGKDRPSLVFFAQHPHDSVHDEDSGFDKMIELKPSPYEIHSASTDNVKPEINEYHEISSSMQEEGYDPLNTFYLENFVTKLSDDYVEPVSAVTLGPGTTLDEAIGSLVASDKDLSGRLNGVESISARTLNGWKSIESDPREYSGSEGCSDMYIGTINNKAILTTNTPDEIPEINNFKFANINGNPIVFVNENHEPLSGDTNIEIPLTKVIPGDGIIIESGETEIDNIISFAGLELYEIPTSGDGNYVEYIGISGDDRTRTIVTRRGNNMYTKREVDDLISGVTGEFRETINNFSGDVVSALTIIEGDIRVFSGNVESAFTEIKDIIEEDEYVTSQALNDLNDRLLVVSGDVTTLSGNVFNSFSEVNTTINNFSGAVETKLNDYQLLSEKSSAITTNSDSNEYPTSQAVIDYVQNVVSGAVDGLVDLAFSGDGVVVNGSVVDNKITLDKTRAVKVNSATTSESADTAALLDWTSTDTPTTVNTYRNVWFSYANSNGVQNNKLVEDEDFQYNPIKNLLKVSGLTDGSNTVLVPIGKSGTIALVSDIENAVASAVNYRGSTSSVPQNPSNGDLWVASGKFVVDGNSAETGDFIIFYSSSTESYWDVIEKNLDGAITGNLTPDAVVLGESTNSVKSLANGNQGEVLAIGSDGKPYWTTDVNVNSAITATSAKTSEHSDSASKVDSALTIHIADDDSTVVYDGSENKNITIPKTVTVSGGSNVLAWNTAVTLATITVGSDTYTIDAKLPSNPNTDVDEMVNTAADTKKAYLVGKASVSGTESGITNSNVFMSGGTIFINGKEVMVDGDVSDVDLSIIGTGVVVNGYTNGNKVILSASTKVQVASASSLAWSSTTDSDTTVNTYRNVWFSFATGNGPQNEKLVQDENFQYNPIKNSLKVSALTADENNQIYVPSGKTGTIALEEAVISAISAVTVIIEEDEYVTSQALNDLNDRLLVVSGDVNTINTTINNFSGAVVTKLDDYQLKSERTTTVDNNSTDNEYPTAKAVYEALIGATPTIVDENVKETTATTKAYLLGHTATGITNSAVTNNSVYMENGELYSNGTKVLVEGSVSDKDEKIKTSTASTKMYLVGKASTTSTTSGRTNENVYMSGGALFSQDKQVAVVTDLDDYQLVSERTTTVSSSSTDNEYPTAKAVYNYVDTAISGVGGSDEMVKTATADTKAYLVAKMNVADTTSGITNSKVFMSGGTIYLDGKEIATKEYVDNAPDSDENVAHMSNTAATAYILGVSETGSSKTITSGITSGVYMLENGLYASRGFYQSSDERLKDFGEDVKVDFDELANVPKKYFTWKEKADSKQHIGTSAQELQKVYPELVKTDATGKLSVDYASLSVIALAAVDKLHKENEELKKRIESIERYLTDKNK